MPEQVLTGHPSGEHVRRLLDASRLASAYAVPS